MKLYGLIGYPLGHSFSKQYFTEKFEKEGLTNCSFQTFPISSISQFTSLIKEHSNLKGLSVTIPYKEQVLKFINYLSDEVKQIGATNCINIIGNKLIAYNTDINGFEHTFCKLLQPHHKKALLLGTGGASKAVQFVLKKLEINYLVVTRYPNLNTSYIGYNSIDEKLMNEYTVIINASPAGMWPNENICPDIPYQFVTPNHYLYDLVYKPQKTLFMQRGETNGAAIQNGYGMLLLQAEASWKIWNTELAIS